ncbi:MAG: response regulator transcription factor [Comamonadaceae bacterium]|nr:response regulator transcription factor [Comamonadaceae bacterium]RRD57228.1 DNA-binding response regulator [Comamonadaceae bacterium OH2545_COT-014]
MAFSESAATHAYGLVIDDHPLVAQGTAVFLQACAGLADVALAADAQAVWAQLARRGAPRIALLDFWLDAGPARPLVQALRERCPGTPILVVSGDNRPGVQQAAQAAGAHGFVGKNQPPHVLGEAVRTLLQGGSWFTPLAPEQAGPGSGAGFDVLPTTPAELGLTDQQGVVLAHLLQGRANKRIAQAMALSEATVKEHVSAVLRRLGVRTRFEAMTRLSSQRLQLPEKPLPDDGA